MSVNLFIMVPSGSPLNSLHYSGGIEVLSHIVNGVLVLAFAGAILGYGFRLKNTLISRLSVLALIFVIVAVATGFTFALRGQDNSFSIAMAMSFLTIYTVYFSESYLVGRMQAVTQSTQKTLYGNISSWSQVQTPASSTTWF